jgi:polyhydroxyalkanoate synthesis repressor PhaR
MVKQGVDFVVYDAKTNEDITRSVLTQIIFDEESRGQNLLPIQFLRQLIRFYGDSMQAFVPSFLELSLDSFTREHDHMRGQPTSVVGLALLEDQVRQNMAMFDRAMKMFSPFAFPRPDAAATTSEAAAPKASPAPAQAGGEAPAEVSLDDLKLRIEEMQQQIAKLAAKDPAPKSE